MDSRGFTLIEMLVALLAASLLLVPLGWMVGQLGQRLKVVDDDSAIYQLTTDKAVLANLLSRARFVDDQSRLLPQSSTRLEFIAPLPDAAPQKTPGRWTLENMDGAILLTPIDSALPAIELFKGHKFVSFSVSGRPGYPDNISVLIKANNGKLRELVFRSLISSDSICDFDLVTRVCR